MSDEAGADDKAALVRATATATLTRTLANMVEEISSTLNIMLQADCDPEDCRISCLDIMRRYAVKLEET